jgi:hypothetical protein
VNRLSKDVTTERSKGQELTEAAPQKQIKLCSSTNLNSADVQTHHFVAQPSIIHHQFLPVSVRQSLRYPTETTKCSTKIYRHSLIPLLLRHTLVRHIPMLRRTTSLPDPRHLYAYDPRSVFHIDSGSVVSCNNYSIGSVLDTKGSVSHQTKTKLTKTWVLRARRIKDWWQANRRQTNDP